MSADNWATCPTCKKDAERIYKEEADKVSAAYGNVTADKYLELVKAHDANSVYKIVGGETLREDFEIGVDVDGEFFVSYRASCDKCGYRFNHSYKQDALKK